MSEKKFTPGPWVVYRHLPTDVVVSKSGECSLATLDCGCGDRKTRRANAHLIAAAPELYKALEEMSSCLSDIISGNDWGAVEEYLDDARAALAKARGETL